jgi:hypothetical protein
LIKRATQKHKVKLLLSAPIFFAFFVNVDVGNLPANMIGVQLMSTSSSKYVAVGEKVVVSVRTKAVDPVNVAAGVLHYPNDVLKVTSVSTDQSMLDLWVTEPAYSEDLAIIPFGGGTTHPGGYSGTGEIFNIHLTPTYPGKAELLVENPLLLAHDGKGTNIVAGSEPLTLYIRKAGSPSPDLNGDETISMTDVNILYFAMLRFYNPRYDLNGDRQVNFGDLKILFDLFGS